MPIKTIHTLLIVDDEESVLSSLQRLFRKQGYAILTALDGYKGLEILSKNSVSLIISDQQMPQMNGYEFLEKSKQYCPEAIRFLLTGHANMNDLVEAVNRGEIHRYFPKPWNNDDLILQVKLFLKQYEQKAKIVTHDPITGILNRDKFIEKLDQKIVQKINGVLLLGDLDGFKFINDVYGYSKGDEYLKKLVQLIHTLIPCIDDNVEMIGRFGEDEIILFLPYETKESGFEIAEKIRKKVVNLKFTKNFIRCTISFGIVHFPENGKNLHQLLSRLDSALFKAKSLGKNKTYLFCDSDNYLINIHSNLKQRDLIIDSLENQRFEIWFQPILNLHTYTIDHYEVLIRMRDTQGNIILPGNFIPTAENCGLINSIDNFVTTHAINYITNNIKNKDISLAINLSGKNIGNQDFANNLKAMIQKSKINSFNIIFEITETAAIDDLNNAIKFINKLKSIGCRFSLDDFGVGFTSFTYLRKLNVDFLKIDGSFIKQLHKNKDDQLIVKAITDIAQGMKIKTIAEFVETEEIIPFLKKFNIDYAQGFFIGKPMPNIKLT